MQSREHIKLSVSVNAEVLKFTVLAPADAMLASFEVPTDQIEPVAKELRWGVKNLCDGYREGLIGEALRPHASLIARSGARLRAIIFGDDEIARDLEERLRTGGGRLTFYVDYNVKVHPPYGLMFGYSGPQKTYKDLSTPELQVGFWRDLHDVQVIYPKDANPQNRTKLLEPTLDLDGDQMEVYAAFHPGAVQHIKENDLNNLWNLENVASTREELERQLISRQGDFNLLYFFCHATGEKLILSDDPYEGEIFPHDLSGMIQNRRPTPAGFLFLNGCKTAVFHGNGKWLRAAAAGGFLGFIGTEETIPTMYAWSFGNDLLKLILSKGMSPIEALKQLWKQHWPLSLLYGLYCIGDIRVTPSLQTPYLEEVGDANYCERKYSGSSMTSDLPFQGSLQ